MFRKVFSKALTEKHPPANVLYRLLGSRRPVPDEAGKDGQHHRLDPVELGEHAILCLGEVPLSEDSHLRPRRGGPLWWLSSRQLFLWVKLFLILQVFEKCLLLLMLDAH